MKFENGRLLLFEVPFFPAYYLLLSAAVLYGICLHHRVIQYKVQTMFFLVFFQRENSEVAIFTCSRYERGSSHLGHLYVSVLEHC